MKKFLRIFASIILSLSLFVLLFFLTLTFVLRISLNPKTISQVVLDTDLSSIYNNMDIANQEVTKNIYDALNAIGIPKTTIDEVINSSGTKNFVAKYLTDTVSYLILGKDESPISEDDLIHLFEDNYEIISESLVKNNVTLLDEYKNVMNSYVVNNADTLISFFPTPKELLGKIKKEDIMIINNISLEDITNTLAFLISNKFLIFLIVMLIGVMFLLYLLNHRKSYQYRYYAVTFTTYAFLLTGVLIFLLTVFKSEFIDKLPNLIELANYLVNTLSKIISIEIVLVIIMAIIFSSIYHKKKRGFSCVII